MSATDSRRARWSRGKPRQGASARVPGTARAAAVTAALTAVAVAAGCSSPPTRESVPLPPGVPPPPGPAVPVIDLHAAGRTSIQLRSWAEELGPDRGIPVVALEAYGNAAETMRQTRPGCHLDWTTAAGIGWIESRHGTYRGAHLDDSGRAVPPIVGIRLDGSPGFENLPDTDGGALDGDTEHDRAVGPLQFIPESWKKYGVDADGDGTADPQVIDDAAVAAARLLCDHDRDLGTGQGWRSALMSYNNSLDYLQRVRDSAAAYSVGTTAP